MASGLVFRGGFQHCFRVVAQRINLIGCPSYLHIGHAVQKNSHMDSNQDEPIKYTTSKAHDWKSYQSFSPPERDVPPYQPIVVTLSTAVFLLYFLVLREENDWDEEIGQSLYSRIPGLEEKQLKVAIDHAKMEGKDTTHLQARLDEIRKMS